MMEGDEIEKKQITGSSVKCSPNDFILKLLLKCMPVMHHNVPLYIRRNSRTISFGSSIAFHLGWIEEGGREGRRVIFL